MIQDSLWYVSVRVAFALAAMLLLVLGLVLRDTDTRECEHRGSGWLADREQR